ERSRAEGDDQADATRALREMLSAGGLSKMLPVKEDGQLRTKLLEQEGPIAFIESTTVSDIFEEDKNRCILINTDERAEQTRRILRALSSAYGGMTRARGVDQIIQKHHALQRMLEQLPVVIPFAGRLGELFESGRVEARRAFPHLMGMVQAAALLHQRQRQR